MKITIEDTECNLDYKYSIEVPHLYVDELLTTFVGLFVLYGYQLEAIEEAISQYEYKSFQFKEEEEYIEFEKGSAEWAWEKWCIEGAGIRIACADSPRPAIVTYNNRDRHYWLANREEFIQGAKNHTWELENN